MLTTLKNFYFISSIIFLLLMMVLLVFSASFEGNIIGYLCVTSYFNFFVSLYVVEYKK